MPAAIRTTCPYCGVGCGVLASPDGAGGARIAGDPDHPANLGRLCSKGSALGDTLGLEGRLLAPRVDCRAARGASGGGSGGREASWDEALDLVAGRFSDAVAAHGPDSVAVYASGQLLTEDYYVANKLMKGFIGSANIDTNSRLCMASSVAAHRRAFGADIAPGVYEDLEAADLVVLVGSNLAWCHPVLHQRLMAAKAVRPGLRIVNIDPRGTATGETADLVLRLAPDSDAWLFAGLLAAIDEAGAVDAGYVGAHVSGCAEALARARAATPARVAAETGLAEAEIRAFWALWIGTGKVVTLWSQGANQSGAGTDKVNAIINCHLATGRIGRPGMGPLSVTGQPNAMGGREVGGLANMLAAHLDLEDPAHRDAVRAFWAAPRLAERPGLKAVDLFRAAADGRIRALWIISTNPAVSMPEADAVRAAIRACPFVVVSDVTTETDTAKLADVLLPAAAWGEKSGAVTNSERRISRQRPFLPPPGQARPDWRIICDVAARMGFAEAFAFDGPAAIFREHAALSAVAAGLGRGFDLSGLAAIDDAAYRAMAPVQWPVPASGPSGGRFFAEGGFFTPDRRARMVPVDPPARADGPPPDSGAAPARLRLNTGRVRDHWHTMTRTARSPRLSRHLAEPFLELHPEDAAIAGIGPADLVEAKSPLGAAILRALVTDRAPKGVAFAPMHWTGEWASRGRANVLVPARTDPVSGQPALKAGEISVARFAAGWHGYAVAAAELRPETAYWARARIEGGWQAELADRQPPEDWERFARALLGAPGAEAVTLFDPARGLARIALVAEGRLAGVLFAEAGPVALARSHVAAALALGAFGVEVLAGRPGNDRPDPGPIVCACFDIGLYTIRNAIAEQALATTDQIGAALRAGTNCGSCRPELSAILRGGDGELGRRRVA